MDYRPHVDRAHPLRAAHLPASPIFSMPVTPSPLESLTAALISVIVPACNEEANIRPLSAPLLAIESVPIEILAIDDRSTDATGAIMDRVAAEELEDRISAYEKPAHRPPRHRLPAGWMGKTHAMALAARQATTPWLLFTDADILFSPDSLLRALNSPRPSAPITSSFFPPSSSRPSASA